MYTVTFYSYKGGVGRTMALSNIAYLLAKAGKRVLVVDFDLEAPGLPSYEPFRCAGEKQGVVEYVSAFIETNEAPDASEYIVKCNINDVNIWMMPAGNTSSPEYSTRYGAIDWTALYENHSGFLFMEDLKQQWEAYEQKGFDYVLIDSRTGYTDIGGICTRQLPDAVVVMFVPTLQNIEGLSPIIGAIRREKSPVRREKVKLYFCPSNVPDLDDDESILQELLDKASDILGYDDQASLIHHYRSLDILQQPLYSSIKPKSRLVKQYETLRSSIEAGNIRDKDGAVAALQGLPDRFDAAREANDERALTDIEVAIAQIRAVFPSDPEVAWGLAALANKMNRPEDEMAALSVVIGSGREPRFARLQRAVVAASIKENSAAIQDLEYLLTSQPATAFEVRPGIELLQVLDEVGWRSTLEKSLQNAFMDVPAKSNILAALLTERSYARQVADFASSSALTVETPRDKSILQNSAILALIADGRFDEAMRYISPARSDLLKSNKVPDVFNYAIAEWGSSGQVPIDLFQHTLELRGRMQEAADANGLQCFALSKFLLGQQSDALEDLKLARIKALATTYVFSCWRYLTVSSQDMVSDIDEMIAAVSEGVTLNPPGTHVAGGLRIAV